MATWTDSLSGLFQGTPQAAPSYAKTSSDVPKWLQDYTVDLFSQQRAVSSLPYKSYELPRIAQTTAPTQQAYNTIQESVGDYQAPLSAALTGTQDLANTGSYSNVGNYMNPYNEAVTNQIAKLGARNLTENLLPGVSDQFIRAGSFGGSRMGEFGNRALRDTQEAVLGQQANVLNTGYTQAMTNAQQDMTRQQGALAQVGDLAKMQQGLAASDAAALQSIGAEQQAQQQKGLDVAYQDFLTQQQYPQQQINNMSATVRGLPPAAIPTTQTQVGSTTQFSPSPLSQVASAYFTSKALGQGYARGGEVKGYAEGGKPNLGVMPGFSLNPGASTYNNFNNLGISNKPNLGAMSGFSLNPRANIAQYLPGTAAMLSQRAAPGSQVRTAELKPTQEYSQPKNIEEINAKYYEGGSPYYQEKSHYARGGEVKGYARGTEDGAFYDETDPDFAAQVQNNMNENPLYAQREVAAPAPAARPSAIEEALAQRRAIMADLNKALTAAPVTTSGMTDSERNWRLAAAFAKPGKTGTFGEGLGYAAETMADVAAEKRKEAREASTLGLQRLQARSELANQQYAMAREGEMQDLLKKYVSKGQGVTDKVTSGATSQSGGASDGVPEDVKALILAQPTEKAVATIIEIAKENNKPSDLIKGVNFLVKNGAISQEQGNAIVQENLQGKLEQLDVQVPELGGTVKLTGPEARLYYADGTLPTRLGGKAKTTAAPSPDTSVAPAKPAAAPVTQEQMKAKETGMVEQAKKDIDASDALLSQKSFAKQQKDAAKLILGYAKTSPKSFGVIADPTWSNAVANLLETGINTPFGSLGLAVEEPIAKLKLTGPEATVRQMAAAPIALIEVGYRKLYLKGEGAVSNMEGALTKYIGPQLSDNAKTVQLKAGMITIGAEKQEKIVDAFEKYKEAHPEAGPRSFYQTPEYKRIVDGYETKYRAFAKANGIPIEEEAASSGSSKGGNLLDSLKKDPRWNK